jgi:hypothetical protein
MDQEDTDTEIIPSSEEESNFLFEYDGDLSFQEYKESETDDTDLDTVQTKRYIFPKPMNYQLFESTEDIDEMFNNRVKMFEIPRRWIKRTNSSKITVKLCRHYLLNKKCEYHHSCKFSHHYCHITRCKYDYCKKTKLIGDGVFINTNSNICRMRHHLETLNSFIFRTRQVTNFDLHLHSYSEFLEDFKKSFIFPMKCQKLWLHITS